MGRLAPFSNVSVSVTMMPFPSAVSEEESKDKLLLQACEMPASSSDESAALNRSAVRALMAKEGVFEKKIMCSVIYENVRPGCKIVKCGNGHSVCGSCSLNRDNCCSVCGATLSES